VHGTQEINGVESCTAIEGKFLGEEKKTPIRKDIRDRMTSYLGDAEEKV